MCYIFCFSAATAHSGHMMERKKTCMQIKAGTRLTAMQGRQPAGGCGWEQETWPSAEIGKEVGPGSRESRERGPDCARISNRIFKFQRFYHLPHLFMAATCWRPTLALAAASLFFQPKRKHAHQSSISSHTERKKIRKLPKIWMVNPILTR